MSQPESAEDSQGSNVTVRTNDNAASSKHPLTIETIFGSISWLMLQSPAHRHLFLSDYEWLVMPALKARQFKVIRNNNKPLAYVSWAYLDEDAEKRFAKGITKLKPNEWNKGDNVWIIDLVAPFGGAQETLQKLHDTEFKGKTVKLLRPKKAGRGMEAVLLEDVLQEHKKQER